MPRPFEVPRADLSWDERGTPLANRFSDTYFSREGGIRESTYLFIEHNRIKERIAERSVLTIAELGFGTGLNFLLTWQAWREARRHDSLLDYVSCEQFPLTREDLERALRSWPELEPLSSQLREKYNGLAPGFVRLLFEQGRVTLTLLIGDARTLLPELDCAVDVWYLDGFAPAKNPELWGAEIFKNMQRLSHHGTSFSSFTAAGAVRDQLQRCGFHVRKIPGYGKKRESICGQFEGPRIAPSLLPPWKSLPVQPEYTGNTVTIIGGGLAGFGAAAALCARGFQVTILEAAPLGFGGASGNRAGIFVPYIARESNRTTDLYLSSYLFSLGLIREFQQRCGVTLLNQSGALQSLYTARLKLLSQSFDQLGLDPLIARLQTSHNPPSIYFPEAGWISAPALCTAILSLFPKSLTTHYGQTASSLLSLPSGWRTETQEGSAFESDIVVIASAQHASRFEQSSWIPLEPIRGEIIYARETDESKSLNTILMGQGYVLPPTEGEHLIGASYAHGRFDTTPDSADQNRLFSQAVALHPALAGSTISGSRVSFRTSTHHRLPYVGPVVDYDSFQQIFHTLRKGHAPATYTQPEYHRSLYISAGHGSRGLISTFASGELLANYICRTTPLLKSSLRGEMNPASYLAKIIYAEK